MTLKEFRKYTQDMDENLELFLSIQKPFPVNTFTTLTKIDGTVYGLGLVNEIYQTPHIKDIMEAMVLCNKENIHKTNK